MSLSSRGLGDNCCAAATRRFQREVERVGHIFGFHRGAELPRDNITAVIIQDGAEVKPPLLQQRASGTTDNLEIGETGLPKLVGACGFIAELIGRLHHDMRRRRYQIFCLQDAIN